MRGNFIGENKSTRRHFLRQVAGLGAGAALAWELSGCGSDSPKPNLRRRSTTGSSERPNFLFILLDDLRWDALSCMGHPFVPTPNIDRLAHEGLRFANAFVTTSLCAPSRGSMLTGVYAHCHGVCRNQEGDPDPSYPTFPQLLRQAGYDTALIGQWHCFGPDRGPRPGFNYWLNAYGGPNRKQYREFSLNENGRPFKFRGYRTDVLTDYAVQWLRKPRQEPFCLWLAHKAVHTPCTPATRHAHLFSTARIPPPPSWEDTLENKPEWQRRKVLGLPPSASIPPAVSPVPWDPQRPGFGGQQMNYLRTLVAADESVGRVLTTLENLGGLDSTVVVFASDNGFLHGEHRLFRKVIMYEESIRIPLLIRYPPRITPGRTVPEMVLNIDLAPTFLELAGLPASDTMQGQSLVPLLSGSSVPWRTSFLYESFCRPSMLGVRTERTKYVTYPEIEDLDELYDLENDPFEMNNLAVAPGAETKLQAMRQELQHLLDETGYAGAR